MQHGSNGLKTAALLGLLSAILVVGGRWMPAIRALSTGWG